MKKDTTTTKPKTKKGPGRSDIRRPKGEDKVVYAEHLPAYLELTRKLIPHSTACDNLGLPADKYAAWIHRFPAVSIQVRKAHAEGMIELQQKAMGGGSGWQALFRVAESLDPENWMRSVSTTTKKAGYHKMLGRARKR